ncbi:MAG: hypothetical protein HON14_05090 [Rhodospirillaceae bacterium]|jgi:hypothetical protein|nr:hypothetical protein [Rhodospirillaceae bacterium]MBT4589862.1 hypothetical protein [Rhodospirillaceae bacterium]MBT4938488.1 hypothetical protein [Rhodospirillaceae bacterium]MBT5939147.1 hypothetical protein [Rhodospirillaceae bacterium]MBT7267446.1 hypothetical protein [Rhodospirillaceae bacterium]
MHLNKFVLMFSIGFLAACAQSSITAEKNPPPLSIEERQKIKDRVYRQLIATYRYHKSGTQDREVIIWRLRKFVFSLEPLEFSKTKEDIQKLEDQTGFLALMEQAQAWRKGLENSPAEKIYQIAGEIRRQINTIPYTLRFGGSRWDGLYIYKSSLADYLLELAGNKGHARAKTEFMQIIEYDAARTHLEHDMKTSRKAKARKQHKLSMISNLANQNYLPAQFDLFHRYKDGRKVSVNLAASHYWGKRAFYNGADIKKDIEAVAKHLTPPEKLLIQKWEDTKKYPPIVLMK